jgi:hypothetical protein
MVIVQLLGGMGNQMFQYALGRALAIANNTTLQVDTTILRDHSPGVHAVNRNYDLDIFALKVNEAQPYDIWKYNRHSFSVPGKIISKLYEICFGSAIIREKGFRFDGSILSLKGDLYLAGLWQSPLYFQHVEDTIRNDFAIRLPLDAVARDLAQQIRNKPSVCLNVRRTDFLTVASTSGTLGFIGIDYYKKASAILNEKFGGDLHYHIFSDDIEWCTQNMNFLGDNVTFVDHRFAGPKFSTYLELMRMCQHFIIPNSTFAWWAAWLSTRKDKTVVAPAKWFADARLDTSDLIPEGWIRA